MSVGHGNAQTLSCDRGDLRTHDFAVFDFPPNFKGFLLTLFFFAADKRDHVIENFWHRGKSLARARNRLIGTYRDLLDPIGKKGVQQRNVRLQRAVAFYRYEPALRA